jgi:ubiquinone/menaquinone biosynthesis C-methylase UbiE
MQTYTDENLNADNKLPFGDNYFNVIINRHESFNLTEVNRTLKRGGYFITQQVGNKNTNEFMKRLNGDDFVFDRTHHTIEKYTAN